MIKDVKKIFVKKNFDDRGSLTEILRNDDAYFIKFGQIYVSHIYKEITKAWHAHKKQTDIFYVVKGTLKIGIYDDRKGNKSNKSYQTEYLGENGDNAILIIPPNVWHGVMALEDCTYLNIPSEPYNAKQPDELRKDISELKDIWTVKNR